MINKISFANKVFENLSRSIKVNSTRCSRVRHKSSDCTLCYMYCETNSIEIPARPSEPIKFNRDTCTDCGICVNLCPTDCFKFINNAHAEMMLNFIKGIDNQGILTIDCAESSVTNSDTIIRCIGLLSCTDILTLYLSGASTITIKHSACIDCVIKHGRKIIAGSITDLRMLSDIFSYLQPLTVLEEDNIITIKFPKQFDILKPVIKEKPNPTVNRRGLFSFYKDMTIESVRDTAGLLIPDEQPLRLKTTFDQYLPATRIKFLDNIMRLGDILTDVAPTGKYINMVNIYSSCVFCGLCAKFCPTGALTINEDKNKIHFNPSKCVTCNLCKVACYHNQLDYKPQLELKYFFNDILIAEKREEK